MVPKGGFNHDIAAYTFNFNWKQEYCMRCSQCKKNIVMDDKMWDKWYYNSSPPPFICYKCSNNK